MLLAILPCPAALANVGGFAGGDGTQVRRAIARRRSTGSASQTSQYAATLDPSGTSDVVFGGGEKEDSPDQWTFTPGDATSKSDAPRGPGRTRSPNPTHDTNYPCARPSTAVALVTPSSAFELNQSATPMVNGAGASIVCPATGDVIVSFEIPGRRARLRCTSTSGAGPAALRARTGSSGSFSALALAPGSAELALNPSASISNFLSTDALGTSFPAGTFRRGGAQPDGDRERPWPRQPVVSSSNHVQVTSRSSSSIHVTAFRTS